MFRLLAEASELRQFRVDDFGVSSVEASVCPGPSGPLIVFAARSCGCFNSV